MSQNKAPTQPPAAASLPDGIEIFKAGTHIDDSGVAHAFSEQDVADMAAGYNPAMREAPLTIGHPKDNKPAWGWVDSLKANAGRLLMNARDVVPAFAELVNARQYKKRSTSLYPPSHPNNPTPGKWYVRHVAFLGAQQPAVAGLVDFASGPEDGTLNFSEADGGGDLNPPQPPEKEQNTMSDKDKILEPAVATLGTNAAVADAQRQLDEANAKLKAAEQKAQEAESKLSQFAESEQKRRTAEFASFAETLAKQAIIKPPEKAMAVAAMQALDAAKPVEFSEGNTTRTENVLEWFKTKLAAGKPLVQFGEHAPGNAGQFKAGVNVQDMSDEDFDKAVRAHMRDHNIKNYAEAAQALAGGTFTA